MNISIISTLLKKYLAYISVVIIVVIILSSYVWSISRLPNKMEMYVFDTKGKPSIFIRTPDDARILIDGGANGDIIRYLSKILPFYSRRIDTVIVTSDSSNNVTGLIDVINRYNVGSIIVPKITIRQLNIASPTDQIYETFFEKANQLKISIKEVERGGELDLNKEGGLLRGLKSNIQLRAEVLFPVSTTTSNFKYSKASPPELVLGISYGDTFVVLLGDASLKVQKYIASSTSITSNVLIVPHAISIDSVALDLINVVKPEFIIYSQTLNSRLSKLSSNPIIKTKKVDPLYLVMPDHRFNLKQKNTIKVLSDGISIEVI